MMHNGTVAIHSHPFSVNAAPFCVAAAAKAVLQDEAKEKPSVRSSTESLEEKEDTLRLQ